MRSGPSARWPPRSSRRWTRCGIRRRPRKAPNERRPSVGLLAGRHRRYRSSWQGRSVRSRRGHTMAPFVSVAVVSFLLSGSLLSRARSAGGARVALCHQRECRLESVTPRGDAGDDLGIRRPPYAVAVATRYPLHATRYFPPVPKTYDLIIAGLGAMGSATAYHAAKRGRRVLGLDRFAPPHNFGSSHGKSRIIREAVFEHPAYVPLARRAYECWAELEVRTGISLLHHTGGISLGAPDSVIVTGARASAVDSGLPYEELSAADITRRIPSFRPESDTVGIWDPRAGVVAPEIAIRSHLAAAAECGAELHSRGAGSSLGSNRAEGRGS